MADAFDALTTIGLTSENGHTSCCRLFANVIGKKFDGDCVEAFIRRMNEVTEIQALFQNGRKS